MKTTHTHTHTHTQRTHTHTHTHTITHTITHIHTQICSATLRGELDDGRIREKHLNDDILLLRSELAAMEQGLHTQTRTHSHTHTHAHTLSHTHSPYSRIQAHTRLCSHTFICTHTHITCSSVYTYTQAINMLKYPIMDNQNNNNNDNKNNENNKYTHRLSSRQSMHTTEMQALLLRCEEAEERLGCLSIDVSVCV